MHSGHQMKIRLPVELKGWLEREAARNLRSMTAEIVFAVRERMERTQPATGNSCQASPAAGPHDTACQGGPATHG